jgi:hypothetical protein
MSGLNQQNQMLAQNQLINQGYNTAFQNAQQAQQFGANLGMQGLQGQAGAYGQALQGAGQLANIGGQQLGAQQNILNTQNQLGAQDTAAQQAIKNQDIQNYATAQQYPYLQLGLMNSMLRGLPMQQSSTSMYQAPPNALSQVAGLGTAGLGAAAMYNQATKAGGGEIKAMADGGHIDLHGSFGMNGGPQGGGQMAAPAAPTQQSIPELGMPPGLASQIGQASQGVMASFSNGGAIPMKMMSDQQLKQVQASPVSSPMANLEAQGLQQLHGYMRGNPQATGVASIPTGNMTQLADGGIVAFAKAGEVKDTQDVAEEYKLPKDARGQIDWQQVIGPRLAEEKLGKNTIMEMMKPQMDAIAAENKQAKAMMIPEFATRVGLGLMASPGGQSGSPIQQLLSNAGTAGLGGLTHMGQSQKDIAANNRLLLQQGVEAAKGDQARRDALTGQLIAAEVQQGNKELGLAQVAATRQAGIDAKQAALINAASTAYQADVARIFNHLATQEKNAFVFANHPEQLWQEARKHAYEAMPEVTRKLLALTPPTAPAPNPAPNPAPAAPAANPVAAAAPPAAPPSVVRNQMPSAPAGTMRWDPSAAGGKGALVPA